MQSAQKRGKMLTVTNGWAACPVCRKNRRLIQIKPDTEAHNLVVFCRDCKTEHIVDIVEGECFESRGR